MRAVLLLLAATAVVLLAAYGLASIPGAVGGQVGAVTFDAPMSVAVTLLLVLFALLYLLLRVLAGLRRAPGSTSRHFRRRRLEQGERAITASIQALAAGELADARREASRARRLLGAVPQTLLITAEAEHASGRPAQAEAAFRALADRRDTAFLGFRGLVRLAVEAGDWARARVLLAEADRARPDTAWLRREKLLLAARTGAWSEALPLARDDAERAAFATAAADAETDRGRAIRLAREAHRLAPDLAPAALAYARRLHEEWSAGKALAVLRETWRRAPHPALAEAALAREPDPLKRAQLAETFSARGTDPLETHLLLARTALDAGMIGEARRRAGLAQAASATPDRRVLTLVADIAERDTTRPEPERRAAFAEALREAATAPAGPVWRCEACTAEHAAWSPVCAHCGTPARIAWTRGVVGAPMRVPDGATPLLLGSQ